MLPEQSFGMLQGRAGLQLIPQRELAAGVVPTQEIQARLDHNFGVLQREVKDVREGIQRLEKAADNISRQLTQGIQRLEQYAVPGIPEHVEKVHNEEMENLRREHRNEVELLQRERALDRGQLEEMARSLRIANIQAQLAARDLSEAIQKIDAQGKEEEKTEHSEDHDRAIKVLFLDLRESVLHFAKSSAIQLGPLPDIPGEAGSWFHPQSWNRASARQRRLRVVARVFHLLFRRILRPALRLFGVQSFLRSSEHHSISAAEAQLRALERDLETQGGKIPPVIAMNTNYRSAYLYQSTTKPSARG
jgi:hypothetical protein